MLLGQLTTVTQESNRSFPTIAFASKHPGINGSGAFFAKVEDVGDECPAGWAETQHMVGENLAQVYFSSAPTLNIIGWRVLWDVTMQDGKRKTYPNGFKSDKPVGSKTRSRTQVLVAFPDDPDRVFLLGLVGVAKSKC